ncbi:transporter, partial [Acinetobacter sp. 11520]|nr:transporter [Acinetobacter sp. 11520]
DHKINADETIALADSITANAGMLGSTIGQLVAAGQLTPAQAGAIQQTIGKAIAANQVEGQTKITTPQSVNLDFQTGIMANTVAFANVRWVNWKDFAIRPYKFGKVSEAV